MTRRKKKKSALPAIEVLIIAVFLGSFIIWAVSRCNATKELYELREKLGETEGTAATSQPTETTTNQPIANPTTSTAPANQTIAAPQVAPAVQPAVYTRLYITIDSLNMRTGPSLDSTIIAKFRIHDEVFYLNNVTEFKEKIFVNGKFENQPWVKVRSRQGKVGWVYGAGVNYYRRQASGGLR